MVFPLDRGQRWCAPGSRRHVLRMSIGCVPLLIALSVVFLAPHATRNAFAQTSQDAPIKVATYLQAPWVLQEGDRIVGFHAELWQAIATRMGAPFEYVFTEEWKEMRDMVARGEVDISVQHHAILADREQVMDFTHPVFPDGMLTLVPPGPNAVITALREVFSLRWLKFVAATLLLLLAVAHVMWLLERSGEGSDFRRPYLAGVWDAFYWTVVTITTVGYGDQAPKRDAGKIFALLWMAAGLFLLSVFVAQVTAAFTVNRLHAIDGEGNLSGRVVGTFDSGKLIRYLQERGIEARGASSPEQLLNMVANREVDALLLDYGSARHMAEAHSHQVSIVGPVLRPGHIGYPVMTDSPLRERVNRALLAVRESGEYRRIHAKWFGG